VSPDERPIVVAPCVPRPRDASDGQSVYVVHAAQALARVRGTRVRALALRFAGQAEHDEDQGLDIERIDPGVRLESPFALYERSDLVAILERFAEAVAARTSSAPAALVHGYELGPAAARLAARGQHVVAVLHYLLAQESERYLEGADDPFRREVMPPLLGALGTSLPSVARTPFVRASSLGAAGLSRWPRASRWARRVGLPSVVHRQLEKLALERQLVSSAHVVVGVSEGFAQAITRAYPRVSAVFCHAGRPDDVSPAAWSPSPRLRLLAVGRPTPQKGWDVLARALAALEARDPALASRIELTLVGGTEAWAGPHSAFGVRTRALFEGLAHVTIHDAGRLARRDVLGLYAEADVLVLPSDYEPFGLVVLEAMSAGCPVLAFDTDGPRDLLADGRSGWCVPRGRWPGRIEALADAIGRLTQLDEAAWRAHRTAARARAARFDWDATARAHAWWLALDRGPSGVGAQRIVTRQ
jgi:glycosyltransferase involved in cell wall biosynthesis